jgi:O-antigen ligase
MTPSKRPSTQRRIACARSSKDSSSGRRHEARRLTEAPALTLGAAAVFVAIAAVAAWASSWRAWLASAAVVVTAPFAWYHAIGPTDVTVSKAAFVGAAIGIALRLSRSAELRSRAFAALKSNRALVPLAAFAVWAAISAAWSVSPLDSARDALKWIWYAGAYALTIVSLEEPGDAMRVLTAMFVTGAVAGIDGLWQSVTSPPAGFVAPNGEVVGRIAATLEGPNQFGAYLETVIAPLVAVLAFVRLSWGAALAGGLLLGLLASDLLLTYSRGALLACSAALLFIVIAAFIVRGRIAGPTKQALAVAFLSAAAVVVPVAASTIGASGWQHEFTALGGGTAPSEQRRVQLWTCAFEVFARRPLLGVGAAGFADAKQECGSTLAGPEHFNANEWYLETAADLGVVGVILLVAFIAALLYAWRDERLWTSAVSIGAFATVIAFVVHGFVDDVLTYPKASLTFFVIAALLPSRPWDFRRAK